MSVLISRVYQMSSFAGHTSQHIRMHASASRHENPDTAFFLASRLSSGYLTLYVAIICSVSGLLQRFSDTQQSLETLCVQALVLEQGSASRSQASQQAH